MMVDGPNDGGIDAMFTDPNSETDDLVLVQSKFYQKISYEDIINAINKMISFYNKMDKGTYDVRDSVVQRFTSLYAEVGQESKVIFVLYTSAPRNRIQSKKYEAEFKALVNNQDNFELRVLFDSDICDNIKEAESRRKDVESGKLYIDETDNYLNYGDDASIVNASAFSIKDLYAQHNLTLLAKNLRYHIKGENIDKAIRSSIQYKPDEFWFKNNGITIICEDYKISGTEVKLKHFSIINGGQTTYNLYKSKDLDKRNDFYLPCKIIKVKGDTEDQRNDFILEIAKATNSQKAIKQIDLKANAPEQIRFAYAMRNNGIYYQTKRGETIPRDYNEDYLNTDLADVGKLCLSAIFQLPGTSRNKPSILYNAKYYDIVFNGDQDEIAKLAKQLLYMDYYFRNIFIKKYEKDVQNNPNADELVPVARNARTYCIAFTAFASRYYYDNINSIIKRNSYSIDDLYDPFKEINGFSNFFPEEFFRDKEKLDDTLYKLYDLIIKSVRKCYDMEHKNDSSLNATNYLKKDSNYYNVLTIEWDSLEEKIKAIFSQIPQ